MCRLSCVACSRGPLRVRVPSAVPHDDSRWWTERVVTGRPSNDAQCLACHKDIKKRVVSANGFRIDHESCAVRQRSASTATPPSLTVARRVGSRLRHGGVSRVPRRRKASTKCDTCHVEKDRATARGRPASFAITHGKEWRKTHGMGNMANCSVCHTAAKCEKCHGVGLPHDKKFLEQHGAVRPDPAAKCSSCHDDRFCPGLSRHSGCRTPASSPGITLQRRGGPAISASGATPTRTARECHVKHVHPGGAVDAADEARRRLRTGGE